MSKLIENTFRHVNIALVNEMLRFSPRARHRPVERHRLRGDQAVRLHGLPAGPGCRRSLHPGRPVLPQPSGQGAARLLLPHGRARRGDQHRCSPLRRHPVRRPAQRPQSLGQGIARAPARRHLQGQHLGLPGEPGRPAREAAARVGCRPVLPRPLRARPGARTVSTRARLGARPRPRPCARPMSWCCCRPMRVCAQRSRRRRSGAARHPRMSSVPSPGRCHRRGAPTGWLPSGRPRPGRRWHAPRRPAGSP